MASADADAAGGKGLGSHQSPAGSRGRGQADQEAHHHARCLCTGMHPLDWKLTPLPTRSGSSALAAPPLVASDAASVAAHAPGVGGCAAAGTAAPGAVGAGQGARPGAPLLLKERPAAAPPPHRRWHPPPPPPQGPRTCPADAQSPQVRGLGTGPTGRPAAQGSAPRHPTSGVAAVQPRGRGRWVSRRCGRAEGRSSGEPPTLSLRQQRQPREEDSVWQALVGVGNDVAAGLGGGGDRRRREVEIGAAAAVVAVKRPRPRR